MAARLRRQGRLHLESESAVMSETLSRVSARLVADNERVHCLPAHFGRHMLTFENRAYDFLRSFSPDYDGAYWRFYELSNGGFYMAPDLTPLLRIAVPSNGFEGTLSADAAGIGVCLFACSHLSFECRDARTCSATTSTSCVSTPRSMLRLPRSSQ
jgi:hypothetical protein